MLKEHLVWFKAVFEKLKDAGLKLKLSKCACFKKSLTYFGLNILKNGIEMDNSKIKRIQEWPVPKMVTDVGSFSGFMKYYYRFIYRYAHVAKPLFKLISGENTSKKNKNI